MNAPQGEIKKRSFLELFNRATLSIELLVIFFTGLTASALKMATPTQVWVTTGVVALLCIIALGLAKKPIGLGVAAIVQVLLIAAGIVIPMMWFLGGVFAIVWVVGIVMGSKIDKEKRRYMHAHPEEYPEVQDGSFPIK